MDLVSTAAPRRQRSLTNPGLTRAAIGTRPQNMTEPPRATLFVCGDVMTGRGVDQVLPRSCPPQLFEPYVRSALDYVALAERAHGRGSRGSTTRPSSASPRPCAHMSGPTISCSIHWGGNWGYAIPDDQRRFAHALIDRAEVDLVHGHSSHHAKAIEVYRERAILYGCGDFLNDYEGIRGYEEYRSDIALMYFPTLELDSGRLLGLELVPLVIRNFRLCRPSPDELAWIRETLDRECRRFGGRVVASGDSLRLEAGP